MRRERNSFLAILGGFRLGINQLASNTVTGFGDSARAAGETKKGAAELDIAAAEDEDGRRALKALLARKAMLARNDATVPNLESVLADQINYQSTSLDSVLDLHHAFRSEYLAYYHPAERRL